MAVINSVSNLSFGANSVAFSVVCGAGPDTLDLTGVVAAAMLAAQPSLAGNKTAIYNFLTTSHTNAAGTAVDLAKLGGLVAASAAGAAVTTIGGDNSLTFTGGASTIAVRISLAASISA